MLIRHYAIWYFDLCFLGIDFVDLTWERVYMYQKIFEACIFTYEFGCPGVTLWGKQDFNTQLRTL